MAELVYLPAGRQARTNATKIMYWVYALKSVSKKYIYVGITDNIDRRIMQHNAGRSKTTRFYSPFKLIYSEATDTRQNARKREKYLKSGVGKEFLKKL